MLAFSHEVILPVFPCMANEIASLTALNDVICSWRLAKHGDAAAGSDKLAECQQPHRPVKTIKGKLVYSSN